MDHDTKVTLAVIALLIVVLGGLAVFLQGDKISTESTGAATTTKDTYATTTSASSMNSSTSSTTASVPPRATSAIITTNQGVIEVALGTSTPLTVENFAKLASSGFYDGTRFHRVIKNFMIQGGDPLSKDVSMRDRWGTGGPDYRFKDELTGKEQYTQGTLAMANAGPNTNGSQFFIVTASPGYPLPPNYTVFGRVTKGLETALKIGNVETNPSNDQPVQDVVIQKIEVR